MFHVLNLLFPSCTSSQTSWRPVVYPAVVPSVSHKNLRPPKTWLFCTQLSRPSHGGLDYLHSRFQGRQHHHFAQQDGPIPERICQRNQNESACATGPPPEHSIKRLPLYFVVVMLLCLHVNRVWVPAYSQENSTVAEFTNHASLQYAFDSCKVMSKSVKYSTCRL